MVAFAELIAASNFSFLRGASHPHEMVGQAAELGLAGIGIADRNTLAGVVRAHQAAKEYGIRLLVGARLVTTDGFETICYPTDRAAYGRLCQLLTRGNRCALKGECHFTFPDMLAASDGQLFIVVPPQRITTELADRLCALAKAAPGRGYLAASFAYRGDEQRRFGELAKLAATTRTPLLATADALYHHPNRRSLADVLTCIREKCSIMQAGYRLEANAERHLKPAVEMSRLFAGYPEAIARTCELTGRITFSLDQLRYEYPQEPVPPGRVPQAYLEELTVRHARLRYPNGVPAKVQALIDKELALIARLDYARYFLTVYDIVRYAREELDTPILCQGRGSAANSAVCYCLGITAVDPTQIDLLFERFISADRREPPDIDVDFEHERREEVIQYIYRRYGRERAAICSTVIHYRPRMAIREVGKAMGLKEDVTASLAGLIWGEGDGEIPDQHITEAGLDPANPAIQQAIALARALLGFPRHLSQHVGGFVLTRERLDETAPIHNGAMAERTFLEWDKDDIDALGMLKVDVLALGMLTCIRKAFDLIAQHYGKAYSLANIPREDPKVYEMLSRADSVGVFQVESRAQMSMLPRLKPVCFYDLVIEVAIVRPGPIQGDMVHPYLRRRDKLEPVSYPSEALKAVLQKTLGVPLFQEQAMQIAIVAAGFTPDEADRLRRAMATFRHVGTIHTFREKFIAGMVRNDYEQEFAERCFSQIEGFGEYGFPESHAASFAHLVYVSSWLKYHYPDAFCAAILNSQPMGFYQPAQLVRDAREHGVKVHPPDINFSDWACTLEPLSSFAVGADRQSQACAGRPQTGPNRAPEVGDGCQTANERRAVRLGLCLISGLAEAATQKTIVATRGDGYADILSLWLRTGAPVSVLERLANADAFRSIGLDRRAALWAVKGLGGGALNKRPKPMASSPASLLTHGMTGDLFAEPAVELPTITMGEHVVEDYAAISLSLKAHPIAFFRRPLAARGILTSAEHWDEQLAGRRVSVAGLVLVRQRPGTAKGVIFLTLEDETGIVNVVVWPKVFANNRRVVMSAQFLEVHGRIERQGLVIHVVAERLVDRSDALRALGDGTAGMPATAKQVREGSWKSPKSRDFH
ncbi:MAG TPA: error-prone DNA polymerase [Hyphomicrobiaceae bacterium]|nr:error-prone DNA polymerase [Hyphomicrobiaceae bacterium]